LESFPFWDRYLFFGRKEGEANLEKGKTIFFLLKGFDEFE